MKKFTTIMEIWIGVSLCLFSFSLGVSEFCENQKPLDPVLALGQMDQIAGLKVKLYETEHQLSRYTGYLQALEDQKPQVIRSVPEDRPTGPNAMMFPRNEYEFSGTTNKRKEWYNV